MEGMRNSSLAGGVATSKTVTGADGKVKVQAKTTWALIDRATGRLMRVRPELAAPFLN